uniref:VWFD domain-containing protein n=1 Tax=Plectus sambesii TaxID=2011161 RepID=A0A914W192_9BILA
MPSLIAYLCLIQALFLIAVSAQLSTATCNANANCTIVNCQIVCTCKQGFTQNAQNQCVPADPCTSQPCKNGGTCQRSSSDPAKYSCNCTDNTHGDNCETILKCTDTSCPANNECFVRNHQLNCVCKAGSTAGPNGVCTIKTRQACMWGEPHYMTFDKLYFDYQGTCPYIVTKPCGTDIDPYFTIRAQNRPMLNNARFSELSWFELNIHGYAFKVHENFTLTVEGVQQSVPYTHYIPGDPTWRVKASVSAGQMYITTPENIGMRFYSNLLCVTVPEDMVKGTGRLCGLFGDVDDDCRNDMRGPTKNIIGVPPSGCDMNADKATAIMATRLAAKFGDEWIDDFQNGACLRGVDMINTSLPCTPTEQIAAQQACQAIELARKSQGIFGKCNANVMGAKLDKMYSSCVYDVCADKNMRCKALTNFVQACQEALPGITYPLWRSNTSCPLTCPPQQYYSDCVSGCQTTCANKQLKAACNQPCVEGCTCADGTVLDGSGLKCIPEQKCGCKDEKGNYYETGSTWMNSQCTKAYQCMGNDNLVTKDVTCGSKGYCSTANNQYQCSCSTGSGTCKTASQTINNPNEYILCSC